MTIKISEWNPTNSQLELGILGKLLEELNECGSAAARCIIQGIDEKEPTTGEVNREWLEKEIADVAAMIDNTIKYLGLNSDAICERILQKLDFKQPWFEYLKHKDDPV